MAQQRQDPDPRAWDETKHKIGDSNIRPFGMDFQNPVFRQTRSQTDET